MKSDSEVLGVYRKWRRPYIGNPIHKTHQQLVHWHWSYDDSWLITLLITKLDECWNESRHGMSLSLFKSCTLLIQAMYKHLCLIMHCCVWVRVQAWVIKCHLWANSQLKIRSIGASLIDTLSIAFSLVNMLIQYSTLLPYYRSINYDFET